MVGHTLVVVHGATHPSDDDWAIYLDALRRDGAAMHAQLVVTEGGTPTSAQRKASLELAQLWDQTPPTAVVTSSILARGAVTALSWFMKERIRAFAPAEFGDACLFIGAGSDETALREAVTRLRATLQ
jgi:DNA-binding LacI/PurR family transcriptional regulator